MATTDRRGVSVDATDTAIAGSPNPGLAIKAPVRVATTANITLSGLQTIDGVALAAGDRVLVKDQTTQTANGLYNPSTGNWTRTIDAASSSQFASGMLVAITLGTVNAGRMYQLSSVDQVDVGTDNITWTNYIFIQTAMANLTVSGTASITGAATFKSTLGVAGATTLSAATTILGALAVSGATALSAATTILGALAVSGAATFSAATTAASTLAIVGNVTVNTNKFTVAAASGNTVVAGTLSVTGDIGTTGNLTVGGAGGVSVTTGPIASSSPSGGIGYTAGAGGTVTQGAGSGKATTVVLNRPTGTITMNNASLAAGATVSFTLTNSCIQAAGDVLILNHIATGTFGGYTLNARCGAGAATIDVHNVLGGPLAEAIVLQYALIHGINS